MKITARQICFVSFASLCIGGCVESEHPLGSSAEAKPDLRLVGTWTREKDDTPKETLRVSYDAQGKGSVTIQAALGGPPAPPGSFEFFVTRTENASYINLSLYRRLATGPPPSYTFAKYRVSEDQKTLSVWTLNVVPLQTAIEKSQLKGTFYKRGNGASGIHFGPSDPDSVQLKDTPEKMLQFIEALPEKEAFAGESDFVRVD